jgi:hypothetical protein
VKQSVAWVAKRAMVTGLVMGVALWGAGCGGSDDSSDNPPSTTGNRYALAVGIDHYAPAYGAPPLPSCINDANGFAGELAKDGSLWKGAGKPMPASITVWTDSSATLAAIRARLQGLASLAQPGDLVVYFHSSHGGNDGTSDAAPDGVPDATYLCAYDASYEDETFAQDLALFRDGVNVVIVIDACFSAGLFKGGPVFDFPQRVMKSLASTCKAKSVKGPSVGWMASSDYTETSAAGAVYSRFTQYLIEAFASGDVDHDGNLTFKELFDYAVPRTQPAHNPQSLNDALLASVVAAAVDPSPGGGGGGGGTVTGTATLRVTNNFVYDQTIFVDEVLVGVVLVGQTQDFTVSVGTHAIRAWDATTGSVDGSRTFAEGSVQTFTIGPVSLSRAKTVTE